MRENPHCIHHTGPKRTCAGKAPAHWQAAVAVAFGLLLASPSLRSVAAEPARATIAIVDFDYVDTSGEARDQSSYHSARLKEFALALGADLERSKRFRVVPLTCMPAPCSLTASEPADLVAAARRSGARLLLFGGIHKQSTLVQWAKVQVVDVDTERLVFDRLLSFRGDNEEAWRRTEAFIAKDLLAQSLEGDRTLRTPNR
jgi:hypothetical protein